MKLSQTVRLTFFSETQCTCNIRILPSTGDKILSVAMARIWNNLPDDVFSEFTVIRPLATYTFYHAAVLSGIMSRHYTFSLMNTVLEGICFMASGQLYRPYHRNTENTKYYVFLCFSTE